MVTATKAKQRKTAATPPVLKIDPKTVQHFNLDPITIDRCPFQPRRDFPAEEIKTFGEQILNQGQLVAILVRPGVAGRFELIDGERRYRACKAVGINTIRADCIEATDAEVRAMVLASALQRKDLNAIEEARAFHAAIAAGDAAGPTELAKQLGLSQGHVSNRLRLLALPEDWQSKVISGEIPASHARSVARYKDHPAILEAIAERVAELLKDDEGLGSADGFDRQIDDAAWNATKPMKGTVYYKEGRESIPVFKPTPEQREQLGIMVTKSPWVEKTEERATNVPLWNRLQEEYAAKVADRKAKKADKEDKPSKPANGKPLTAAQQKQLAEEEAQKAKDRAEKFARGAWHIAINWRRYLIAKACRDEQVTQEDAMRLLLLLAGSADVLRGGSYQGNQELNSREETLADLLDAKTRSTRPALWPAIADLGDHDVVDSVLAFVGELFWSKDGGVEATIDDGDVIAMAEHLKIDLAAAWKADAAGPLTERWLELQMKDPLLEFAERAGITLAASTKSAIVAELLEKKAKLPAPAELLKPKRQKDDRRTGT